MPCHPHCNQGRHCDGSCQTRSRSEETLSYALVYIVWLLCFSALAWRVWG